MNWKEFIESLGSDKYLAEQLGVSRGHVCTMRNGRTRNGRKVSEKKIPATKHWKVFEDLARKKDMKYSDDGEMKYIDFNYLGRLER